MPDIARWRDTWSGLGVHASDDKLYRDLIGRYSEGHRRYHTAQHLDECFDGLDDARSLAEHVYEVELALWFHDAVYEVRKQDNEEQSASWAQTAAERAGLPGAAIMRLRRLILATRHNAEPESPDAALLADVDLAILGAPVDRFDEYEQQIREEYSWIPDFVFQSKRREILEGFLARPQVYNTRRFHDRYEYLARTNLTRSIARLAG